jgi:ankyrin repeat protein
MQMRTPIVVTLCCCTAILALLGCAKPKTPPSATEINQFLQAVVDGDVAEVKQFLSTRSNPELVGAKGHKGRTPLHEAAGRGNVEIMKMLLAKGAVIDSRNDTSSTPLHMAAASGQKAAAELLIAKGADIDAVDNVGATPLHYAATLGRADVAELLLAKGASPNVRTAAGITALTMAEQDRHPDVADLIRRHGGAN